jgi:hypothetical protein
MQIRGMRVIILKLKKKEVVNSHDLFALLCLPMV